jgi:hypothetical protein
LSVLDSSSARAEAAKSAATSSAATRRPNIQTPAENHAFH